MGSHVNVGTDTYGVVVMGSHVNVGTNTFGVVVSVTVILLNLIILDDSKCHRAVEGVQSNR